MTGVVAECSELGVNHDIQRNWVAQLRQERDCGNAGRDDLGADERAELLRLRRQVAQLELEKEIPKSRGGWLQHFVGPEQFGVLPRLMRVPGDPVP